MEKEWGLKVISVNTPEWHSWMVDAMRLTVLQPLLIYGCTVVKFQLNRVILEPLGISANCSFCGLAGQTFLLVALDITILWDADTRGGEGQPMGGGHMVENEGKPFRVLCAVVGLITVKGACGRVAIHSHSYAFGSPAPCTVYMEPTLPHGTLDGLYRCLPPWHPDNPADTQGGATKLYLATGPTLREKAGDTILGTAQTQSSLALAEPPHLPTKIGVISQGRPAVPRIVPIVSLPKRHNILQHLQHTNRSGALRGDIAEPAHLGGDICHWVTLRIALHLDAVRDIHHGFSCPPRSTAQPSQLWPEVGRGLRLGAAYVDDGLFHRRGVLRGGLLADSDGGGGWTSCSLDCHAAGRASGAAGRRAVATGAREAGSSLTTRVVRLEAQAAGGEWEGSLSSFESLDEEALELEEASYSRYNTDDIVSEVESWKENPKQWRMMGAAWGGLVYRRDDKYAHLHRAVQ
ncbi:hypothetical protein DFH06DRAFT_1130438 [Mycena polygramma]|nr:hypothetical protein DFH06DRAFT_1130438 [Mycena polygramma]